MYLAGAKIFVSMASYRDPQALPTVKDLFNKADNPTRVYVGILTQVVKGLDDHCTVSNIPNVRQVIIDAKESRGACWARHRIFTTLLHDETFVLQIDSHSRFDQGWDTTLLKMFEQTNDVNAVFSTYPSAFNPETNYFSPQTYNRFDCQGFDKSLGFPLITSGVKSPSEIPIKAQLTPFIAGGCLFTTSAIIRRVPYDPYLYFLGEEINYAIRLWTHGYNIYTPNKPFMYHFYGRSPQRSFHWEDQAKVFAELNRVSFERNRHILGITPSKDTKALIHLDKFCLGKQRTLDQWQIASGIDIKNQTLTDDAKKGIMKQFDNRIYITPP
jgi:hypothetical protein